MFTNQNWFFPLDNDTFSVWFNFLMVNDIELFYLVCCCIRKLLFNFYWNQYLTLTLALISYNLPAFLSSITCSISTISSVIWLLDPTVCSRNNWSLDSHFCRNKKADRSSCKQDSHTFRGNSTICSLVSITSKSQRTFVQRWIRSEYTKFDSNVNTPIPATRSKRFVISSHSFKQQRHIFSKNTVFISTITSIFFQCIQATK